MATNTKDLNKIIKKAYSIFVNTYCGNIYSDTDWSNVYRVALSLELIPGVEEVNMTAGVYYNYLLFDGDKAPYRLYTLDINTIYGNLSGEIQCCSAGTMDNPFSKYDMVLTLWINKSVNESVSNKKFVNESFNILQVIAELKNANDFNDIKRIVKKNIKGGILAGTILAMVLVNFSLSDNQSKEIKQIAYLTEIEYIEDNTIESYAEPEPIWDLLTNDVQATVYHATPNLCNKDVKHTASGFALNLKSPEGHKVIAMERTMMAKYGLKYGDLVMIKGTGNLDGVYQILDTMNKRFKGQHKIDILINKSTKGGKWDDIEIYKLTNPEEVYDTLKSDMAPAINQRSIDKRLGNYIYESFSSRLIKFDFGEDSNTGFSKTNKSNSELNNDTIYNSLLDVMKQTLINETSTNYNMYTVEHNEDDTLDTDVIKYYEVYDINENGTDIMPPADVITGNGVRALQRRAKDLKRRIGVKNNATFTRILVNKNTHDVHICIHIPFWTCKYLTINKPILDFINSCFLNIKSIGVYNGATSNIKLDENNDPILSPITDDVTFFFTKNWKGKSYYLPRYVKPNDKFNSDVILSDELVNNFPTKISSPWGGDKDKRINIYTAMCESIKSYIKIVKTFVSSGYTIVDEFNNVYTNENVEQYESSLSELTSEDAILEKLDKIERFLQNLLGTNILQKFDEVNSNKQTKHLYLRLFYKQNRKQKNIYKKLSGPVVILFLKDNGINIDEIIKESQSKYLDNANECIKYINLQIENGVGAYSIASSPVQQYINDITDYLPTYEYINNRNYMLINRLYSNIMYNYYDENSFNESIQSIMLQRFFYKFNRKTEIENPNGWNEKNRSSVHSVLSLVQEEAYMGGSTNRWMDFCDSSLALDDHSDLMFLFYALGYALINSYSQEHFGVSDKALNELEDANVEPVMNSIDFSAIIKCLSTVLNDMTK